MDSRRRSHAEAFGTLITALVAHLLYLWSLCRDSLCHSRRLVVAARTEPSAVLCLLCGALTSARILSGSRDVGGVERRIVPTCQVLVARCSGWLVAVVVKRQHLLFAVDPRCIVRAPCA